MNSVDTDPDDVKNAWGAVSVAEASTHVERDLKVANALEEYSSLLRKHKLRLLDCVNIEARAKQLRANFYQSQLQTDNTADWQVQMALKAARKPTNDSSRKHDPAQQYWNALNTDVGEDELTYGMVQAALEHCPRFRHKSTITAILVVFGFVAFEVAGLYVVGFLFAAVALTAIICWNLATSRRKQKEKSKPPLSSDA